MHPIQIRLSSKLVLGVAPTDRFKASVKIARAESFELPVLSAVQLLLDDSTSLLRMQSSAKPNPIPPFSAKSGFIIINIDGHLEFLRWNRLFLKTTGDEECAVLVWWWSGLTATPIKDEGEDSDVMDRCLPSIVTALSDVGDSNFRSEDELRLAFRGNAETLSAFLLVAAVIACLVLLLLVSIRYLGYCFLWRWGTQRLRLIAFSLSLWFCCGVQGEPKFLIIAIIRKRFGRDYWCGTMCMVVCCRFLLAVIGLGHLTMRTKYTIVE